jgi:hypothetical protein
MKTENTTCILWHLGGQLQNYRDNKYSELNEEPKAEEEALGPVALLSDDMTEFVEEPKKLKFSTKMVRLY